MYQVRCENFSETRLPATAWLALSKHFYQDIRLCVMVSSIVFIRHNTVHVFVCVGSWCSSWASSRQLSSTSWLWMEPSAALLLSPPQPEDTVSQHPPIRLLVLMFFHSVHEDSSDAVSFSSDLVPFISTVLSQQLLILEMFIITLVTRLLYRRQYEPLPVEEQDNDNENTKMVRVQESAWEQNVCACVRVCILCVCRFYFSASIWLENTSMNMISSVIYKFTLCLFTNTLRGCLSGLSGCTSFCEKISAFHESWGLFNRFEQANAFW